MNIVSIGRRWASRNGTATRLYRAVRARNRILNELTVFTPASWGSIRQLSSLTLQSASQTPLLLEELALKAHGGVASRLSSSEFCREMNSTGNPAQLGKLLDAYGSDKASKNGYHLVYSTILDQIPDVSNLLEVGLGTNHDDVPSSMGPQGHPGSSLRAFRDFLPSAHIHGADVDRRVLFSEDRIDTYFVDQTSKSSVVALSALLPRSLDLVIDDGLHSPSANLVILLLGLDKLSQNGWIVIEDISEASLPVWSTVSAMLSHKYECFLVECEIAYLFCVRTRHEVSSSSVDGRDSKS